MKKLLYIDACVNRDISRTERLAQALLKEMNKNGEYEVETLCLEDEDLKLFTGKESAGREQLTRAGIYEGPMFDIRRPDPCGGSVLGFYFPGENEMLSGADLCDRADLYLFFQGNPRWAVPCRQSPLCDHQRWFHRGSESRI